MYVCVSGLCSRSLKVFFLVIIQETLASPSTSSPLLDWEVWRKGHIQIHARTHTHIYLRLNEHWLIVKHLIPEKWVLICHSISAMTPSCPSVCVCTFQTNNYLSFFLSQGRVEGTFEERSQDDHDSEPGRWILWLFLILFILLFLIWLLLLWLLQRIWFRLLRLRLLLRQQQLRYILIYLKSNIKLFVLEKTDWSPHKENCSGQNVGLISEVSHAFIV